MGKRNRKNRDRKKNQVEEQKGEEETKGEPTAADLLADEGIIATYAQNSRKLQVYLVLFNEVMFIIVMFYLRILALVCEF